MDFLDDYNNRVQDINSYLDFVFLIDKSQQFDVKNIQDLKDAEILNKYGVTHLLNTELFLFEDELKRVLKANVYLMLYNLIEGSITAGIDAIFLAINDAQLSTIALKANIRKLFIAYKASDFAHANKSKKEVQDYFNSLLEKTVLFKHNNFEGYLAYLQKTGGELSGNIDAEKIAELAEKYGFILPTTDISNELLSIKNKRNQLANGEITFTEAGKINSIEELITLKNTLNQYLSALMQNMVNYIKNQEYKI